MKDLALLFGKTIKPFGKMSMIHSRKGERSYFFIDRRGSVTLLPEDMLREHLRVNSKYLEKQNENCNLY